MIYFILGISITLNIILIVLYIFIYKKILNTPYFDNFPIKPKIEQKKYESDLDKIYENWRRSVEW